jgi:hypothetical protein
LIDDMEAIDHEAEAAFPKPKTIKQHEICFTPARFGTRQRCYCSEPRLAFNRTVVLRDRSHLESRQVAPGTSNLRLGAVRRLAYEAADCGLLSADLAAGIRSVKSVKTLGMRLGNCLTAKQGHAL